MEINYQLIWHNLKWNLRTSKLIPDLKWLAYNLFIVNDELIISLS